MYGTPSGGIQQEEKAEFGSAIAGGMTSGGSDMTGRTPMEVELRDTRFHQALLGEWFGTTAFVFFLVLSIMTADGDPVRIGLVAGLSFSCLVYMLASVSGAHFNPAVTFGMWASRRITGLRAACYVLFQLLGAMTGAALAQSVSRSMFRGVNGGVNALASGVSTGSAFWIELLGTLFLVMAVLAASDSELGAQWPHRRVLIPMEVGFTIFLAHVVLIPFTGCSINPARSFGTAVVGHYWRQHWVWWVAPFVGALTASLLYSIVFFANEAPKEEFSVEEGRREEGKSGVGRMFSRTRGEQGNRVGTDQSGVGGMPTSSG